MTVEYIRYRIPQESTADFEAAYARAAAPLSRSRYCTDYELARCDEAPDGGAPVDYILRITWTSARDHIEGFRQSEEFRAFFTSIRPYVEQLEEMRHYTPTAVMGTGASVPTLYAWAGGAEALGRLTEAFYVQVLKDELIGPLFAGMTADHPAHVAIWLGEVFGGPATYTEHHGGYPAMLGHHLGRSITERQRRRWASLLMDAADEVGLPDDAEFRSAFAAYIEWGTRLAVANSVPGAEPPPRAPVPKWGWGVAPPYAG
ncbi:globin domain-containing protein [Streptomyces sp. NBC_00344]|uniref:globin domain-containing protein n=1 Tax=Streptomyces sp. NBC_00344 TaxID=2975720 RepID=UPI002E24936A